MNQDAVVTALSHVFPQLIPEIILGVAACVLFLGVTFVANRHVWGVFSLASLGLAAWVLFQYPPHSMLSGETNAAVFAAPLRTDALAMLLKIVGLFGVAALVLLSWNEIPDRLSGEYHGCLMLIAAGIGLTAAANDLTVLFLALELISIPTYVLLYVARFDNASQEASMKYFLLSVFSSGLTLFGFSYLYGLTGSTNIPVIVETLYHAGATGLPPTALLALVLVVAGLCFRITAVPFHFYAPDVYQGTSTGSAALLSFVPKVVGFVALFRVLGYVPNYMFHQGDVRPGLALGEQVPMLMWILAAVTMTLGNILALLQENIRRMLAYSSVSNAGYMLIGLAVAPNLVPTSSATQAPGGIEAVLFYLIAYGATTLGAFAVLAYLSTSRRSIDTIHDLAGLSRTHPGTALCMALFMFSLIGIPATAGFIGKLLLFWGAMTVGSGSGEPAMLYRILTLIAVINAAIAAWYYLRIVVTMYLRNAVKPVEVTAGWPCLTAIAACAVLTLGLGVWPKPLIDLSEQSLLTVPSATESRAQR